MKCFFLKNTKQQLIVTRYDSYAVNQHIRMISEGSCDTEDCSNDADNSALITGINYILQYIQIENSHFKCLILFHNITVFLIK